MRSWVGIFVLLVSLPAFSQDPRYSSKLAPYVASPVKVVDLMLELAEIKPNEMVYDLGSGDGRILIAAVEQYQARAVGVEISSRLVEAATEEIEKAGLSDRARVVEGDALQTDLSDADVVTLYLDTKANEQLRPQLERYLRNGTRVVSHDHEIPGWKAAKVASIDDDHEHLVYLYQLPAAKQ